MEAGETHHPKAGTPQGGVISPLWANIYLHEVLDVWFEREIKPQLRGRSGLIRYADDCVLVFEREAEARRVWASLPGRFGAYGLRLHPEITRVVRFTPPSRSSQQNKGPASPASFDFLGFTHYWGKSWKGGTVIKRRTAKGRFSRALAAVRLWCRTFRHRPLAEQHGALVQKLRGHYAYSGITGNYEALARFQWTVRRAWHKWLGRRSQWGRLPWAAYARLLCRFPLPPPRVVHSIYRP